MVAGIGHERMSGRKPRLVVEQTLHGYGDGHELLASSSKLPREARRVLLSISDLSGHGFVEGFDGYLTGYPLPVVGKYALARTWFAPEMSRPGCVWTHTLLIDFDDLPRLDALRCIADHFRRPASAEKTKKYDVPLQVEVRSNGAAVTVSEKGCRGVLEALYGECVASVIVEASHAEEYEDLVFGVWEQQWPLLRRRFSFCTGALSLRSVGDTLLDFQIVPRSQRIMAARTAVAVRSIDLASHEEQPPGEEWLGVAATDLRLSGSPLRTFLREYGADACPGRSAFRPLTKCFLALERVRRNMVPVGDLVSTLGEGFRSPDSASRLKRDVLWPTAGRSPWFNIGVSETELLLAALRTEYEDAFDLTALRIEKRAARAIRSGGNALGSLLPRLLESEQNALGRRVLEKELAAVDVGRLRTFFESDEALLERIVRIRPGLLYEEELWRTPRYMQRACLAVAARSGTISGGTVDVQRVLGAALAAGSDAVAKDAHELLGEEALFGVLTWIDDRQLDGRRVPYTWREILRSHSSVALRWFETKDRPKRMETLLLLTEIAEPKDVRLGGSSHVALDRWRQLAASTSNSNDAARVLAYLLSIGLRREDEHACDLVVACFPTVHEALLESDLGWAEWLWLEPLVPSEYRFFSWDWDKADKLRRALLERFSVQG